MLRSELFVCWFWMIQDLWSLNVKGFHVWRYCVDQNDVVLTRKVSWRAPWNTSNVSNIQNLLSTFNDIQETVVQDFQLKNGEIWKEYADYSRCQRRLPTLSIRPSWGPVPGARTDWDRWWICYEKSHAVDLSLFLALYAQCPPDDIKDRSYFRHWLSKALNFHSGNQLASEYGP